MHGREVLPPRMLQVESFPNLKENLRATWRELTQPRGEALWIAGLFGSLLLVTSALLWGHEFGQPSKPWWLPAWWDVRHADAAMGLFALAGLLLVAGWIIIRRRRSISTRPAIDLGAKALVTLLVFASGLNYFYCKRTAYDPWVHSWDSYHYLLGPKYFDEVEYYDLYECTVETLDETVVPPGRKVRDLETHGWTRARALRAQVDCPEKFSEARWEAFRADIQTYAKRGVAGPGRMRHLLLDQGYNGAPFHAFVAGKLANAAGPVTYEKLNRLALIDIAGVCLMLFVVTRRFGWKLGLAFALFVFSNVIDRFGMTGGSFFRLYWLVTLGLGISALYRERWGAAGFWLVVATALNVFPLFFLVGGALPMAWRSVEQGTLSPRARRFGVGVAVAGVLTFGLGAAHGRGVDNYGMFMDNMEVHQHGPPIAKRPGERLEKMPTFGVGLKFPFLYRGQHHKKSKKFGGLRKSDEFKEIEWIYRLLSVALSAWALAVTARLRPYEGSILCGVGLFFFLQGTVAYYFACVAFLLLLWASRTRGAAGPSFIGALFAASVVGHVYLWGSGVRAVLNNTIMSWLLLIYLLAALLHLSRQTGLGQRLAAAIAMPEDADAA